MDDPKFFANTRPSDRWHVYAWITYALLASFGAQADDFLSKVQHFDVPGGDAREQLNVFGQQANIQLLYNYNTVAGMIVYPVKGDLTAADALKALTKGLPLRWTEVNDRTLAITLTSRPPSHWWQRAFAQGASKKDLTPSEIDQVLVSGHVSLNQTQPPGAALIRLDRADIEAAGLPTTQDFLHTLPQVFGGGPAEDTQFGREALTNSSKGSGINLRGLDAGATLVLWDGRRLAPSGTSGVFTDISNLPLSAIDHIDILPAGAGLEYGADGIGGVVNFVTRSNFTGLETQATGGGVTSGSLREGEFSQLWGQQWDGGHAVAGFEFYHRDALRARDRRQETSDLRAFGGSNFDVPY